MTTCCIQKKNDHSSSTICKKSQYLQNYAHRKKSKTDHKKTPFIFDGHCHDNWKKNVKISGSVWLWYMCFFHNQPLQVPDRRFSLLSAYSFNPGGSKHDSITPSAALLREEKQREEDLETVLDITGQMLVLIDVILIPLAVFSTLKQWTSFETFCRVMSMGKYGQQDPLISRFQPEIQGVFPNGKHYLRGRYA